MQQQIINTGEKPSFDKAYKPGPTQAISKLKAQCESDFVNTINFLQQTSWNSNFNETMTSNLYLQLINTIVSNADHQTKVAIKWQFLDLFPEVNEKYSRVEPVNVIPVA